MEQFEFFWNGPFSQWKACKFNTNGMVFNCTEQFMMFCKACHFEDFDSAKKIMDSKSPKEQKSFGRKVKGFNVEGWVPVAKDIVYAGSFLKFTQNPELGKLLEDTEGKILVEASPYDKVWGIGLTSDDPKALQRSTWDGKNWLGEVLTEIRTDIKNMCTKQEPFDLISKLIRKYKAPRKHIDHAEGMRQILKYSPEVRPNPYTMDKLLKKE